MLMIISVEKQIISVPVKPNNDTKGYVMAEPKTPNPLKFKPSKYASFKNFINEPEGFIFA